ncbi:hypothetical protein [Sphingomonas immobilis]|uniref:DUF2029 domain-containing protein n=1 Tax=Sphingomonas immobilis TaxID=3063997 RepID=A0ABT9A3S3_9SPHN|nr:hypothetical protein [Sphingomonas sp. CA1-15]MDO7843994.1 hypothetical protein [Sphingomonas sp. CA1-15]
MPRNRLEHALAALILTGVAYAAWHLASAGFLPVPFFVDNADTYMDWFNTAWWSRDRGTYDVWRSIYPPLSFLFLRMFGIDRCYAGDALAARDCDGLGVAALWAFWLIDLWLIARIYARTDRATALPRTIALGFGLPMLFGLERGNLAIVCLAPFMLAFGPLVRAAWQRWLAAAVAINFKPYLIVAIMPALLRRKWRWFEGALIATAIVYAISWGLFGRGTPAEIATNSILFAQAIKPVVAWKDALAGGSYNVLASVLAGPLPVSSAIGSDAVARAAVAIPVAIHTAQALIALAALMAWLRPGAIPAHRMTALAIAFALITNEAGLYALIFFLYLLFLERWSGIGRIVALVCGYLICLPFDLWITPLYPIVQQSWLGGAAVTVDDALTLGPLVRPGLVIVASIALSLSTIAAAWRALIADRPHRLPMLALA